MRQLIQIVGLVLALLPPVSAAAEPLNPRYATVKVEPSKTSIYIGSVTLTPAGLVRKGMTYSGTYTAKVVPLFFYGEKGTITLDVSEDQLHKLERGEPVDFTGRAQSDDGEFRRVEGRATPSDAAAGKIKVRIFVSKRIELIFNTTYRFGEVSPAAKP